MDTNTYGRYILDGKVPVPCEDLFTWANWLEHPKNRIVKQENVGDFWVSTVFMALDHNWGQGPPLLFETLVFRNSNEYDEAEMRRVAKQVGYEGPLTFPRHIAMDGFGTRTPTWELALEAHAAAILWAKDQLH